MAVEIAGFEMVEGPVENGAEGDKSVSVAEENGKLERDSGVAEPIKFGSHGDEPAKGGVKGEGNGVADSSVPKGAVEEWPAPQQIYYFYFVRSRPYDDPNIKSKIDQLDKEISKKNQTRFQITEALRAKRSERAEIIAQVKRLRDDNRQFQSLVDEKIKEIEPLQQALGKLRSTNGGRGGLCSSEEELNDVIYSLNYRIQHESIPLAEEKQLLREIKQLEGTREKVIANSAMRAKLQDSMGQKEAIQDQVKLIGGDLDGAKKDRQLVRAKINKLEEAIKVIDKNIKSLQDELTGVTQKREQAYENIQQLRKQRDEGNSYFFQSRTLLNKVRELAAKKDINALKELSQNEVDKFMSIWSSDKAFRNDYEKRLLPSLDMRQLSRDGRMRNPDEKPLVEVPKPAETVAMPKSSVKQPKEDAKSSPQDTLPDQKVQKETTNKRKDSKSNEDNKDVEEADEFEYVKPQKETPAKDSEIDPSKLKEIKREEEIAKAKQALERKKKLAEKAAAKAALRAQKEAEKKLKEREKKAKKKAASSNPEELEDAAEVEAAEQEKATEVVEALAPVKEKVQKETSMRSRSRTKGPESIPKVILKRKRSNNYWVWGASAALLVLLVAVVAYNYQSLV